MIDVRALGALAMLSALALAPMPAAAQAVRLELTEPRAFRESFVASPTGLRGSRSVEILVGLRLETVSGRFDLQQVRLGFEGALPGPLCVRMMARDGRYSSTATYRATPQARTPGIDAPTRYTSELSGYSVSDIAINAFVAPACDAAKASEFFAAILGQPQEEQVLVVQVNAPSSRVRAQLERGDRRLGDPVICTPADAGPRIGFTSECRIALRDARPGSYRLLLNETTPSGASQMRAFPLRLGPPA
jgi:hypothetical protein